MKRNLLWGIAASLMSGAAWAHPGHGLHAGFTAGLLHPLTGWDHLLVMFALGIWAARRPARQGWPLPLVFVSVMALFAALAMVWLPMSLVEVLVAASLLVMGGLLVAKVTLPSSVQLGGVALIAAMHGYAHGAELGNHWHTLAGMVLATASLHACGWWLGRQQQPWLRAIIQLLGGLMMGLGAYSLMA